MTARPTPTIALVAVPGPGDERPGSAARAVADLLLRLRGDSGSRYSSFVERAIRIPVKPARVNPRSAPNVAPDLRRSIFAEQHPFLRTQLEYAGAAARDREEDSPDHQLMRAQLAEYRSTGAPYDTVRLEGERIGEATNGAPADVQARLHVYEMRWSDLGGMRSGIGRTLVELYQLFVHLAHLGRTALDHARLEHSTQRVWRLFGATHTWAVRLLTVMLPAIFASLLGALLCAAVAGSLAEQPIHVTRIAVGGSLLGLGALLHRGFGAYDRLRPGAWLVGMTAFAVAATLLASATARAESATALVDGTLGVFQVAAIAASLALDALFLAGALAGALGLVACGRLEGPARARGWRAARTALGALAVATGAVLVAIFTTWAVVSRLIGDVLPRQLVTGVVPSFDRPGQSLPGFFERVLEVSAGVGVPLVLAVMAALALIAAILFAPALKQEVRPPRVGELFDEHANGATSAAHKAQADTDLLWAAWEHLRREGDKAQRLGARVSRASRLAAVLLGALYLTVFFVGPAASVVHLVAHVPVLEQLAVLGDRVVLVLGLPLLLVVAALVGLRRRGSRLVRRFAPLVDALLSVDDHLRTHPPTATPRARVAERYASLLRYLCRWRDRSGRPYDAIVIVAQSQGATMTVDLLSFVQREEDPELEALRRPLSNGAPVTGGRRLFLLTTGAPLRQLYSEWFPHLFAWVRGDVADGISRPLPAVPREPWMLLPRLEDGHRVYAPPIPDDAAPDPYALGLARWVNAYRSGDYIGRALWRQAIGGHDMLYRPAPADAATRFVADVPPVTYVSEDAHRSRRELCIGAGAHTHYWDSTGKAVATELDLLVVDAMRMAMRVGRDTAAPTEGMES